MSATQSVSPRHAVVCVQQLPSRHASHVGSPLVRPHDDADPDDGGVDPPHAEPHVVPPHVTSAFSSEAPVGWADSQAAAHAASLHIRSQSITVVQSGSLRHVSATPQQFVSRHESHAGSPLPKPHELVDGGGGGVPPPHADMQLFSRQVEIESRSAAPVGCDEKHAEMQASSLHASPHVMSAVQSASATHAVLSAQQLASRHESQLASPVERPPQVPPPLPPERSRIPPPPLPLLPSAAMTVECAPACARESGGFQPSPGPSDVGLSPVDFVVVVELQANVSVDAMAIAPKVVTRIWSSKGTLPRSSPRFARRPPSLR